MQPFQAEGLISFGAMSLLTLLALNLPGVLANPASAALALARVYTLVWTHKARLCSWLLVSRPGPLIRWTTFVAAPGLWHVVWCEVLPGTLLLVLWLVADIAYPVWRRGATCVLALGELSDVAWIAICAAFTFAGFLALATFTVTFVLSRMLAFCWRRVRGPLYSCILTVRSACSRVYHLGKVIMSACVSWVKSTVLGCFTATYRLLRLLASRLSSLVRWLAAKIASTCRAAVNVATYQTTRLTKASCVTVSWLWLGFVAVHDRILLWAFAKLDYANLRGRRLSRRISRRASKLGAFLVREPGLVDCAVTPTLHVLQSAADGAEVMALLLFPCLSRSDVSALSSLFHSLTMWRKHTPTYNSTMTPSNSLQDVEQDPDATLTSIVDFEGPTYCESEGTCSDSSSFELNVSELLGGTSSKPAASPHRALRARIPRSMSSESVFVDFGHPRFASLAYTPKVDDGLFYSRSSHPPIAPEAGQVSRSPAVMLSPRPEDPDEQNRANMMMHTAACADDRNLDDRSFDVDLDLPPHKRGRRAGKRLTARRRRQQEMVARAANEAMMQAVAAAAANAAAEFTGRDGQVPKVFVQLAGGTPAADEVEFF